MQSIYSIMHALCPHFKDCAYQAWLHVWVQAVTCDLHDTTHFEVADGYASVETAGRVEEVTREEV